MKLYFKTLFCLILFVLIVASSHAFAQGPASGDSRDIAADRPPRTIGCDDSDQLVGIHIEARSISEAANVISARGKVLFQSGKRRLTASDAVYNYLLNTGVLHDVTYTTCMLANPEYRLTAKEISLLPNQKLHARDISLYLGRVRVLRLPSIKLRVGGRNATRNVFPRVGFDKRDGFSISQDYRFVDDDNLRANADLRLTTLHGIQGQVYSSYGFDGDLSELPGRYLTFASVRSDALELPLQVDEGCTPESLRNYDAARLRATARVTLRQRTYDVANDDLTVYRQPEIGLHYVADQINLTNTHLDPRLEIYPEITGSWGRFREDPGQANYTQRSGFSAIAAVNLLPLGPNTAIQPLGSVGWNKYQGGDTFTLTSYGLDASHLLKNGSIASLRYVQRRGKGITPFQFDDIDINRELQSAFQIQLAKHFVGLVVGYNFDSGTVYDWEAMYGWRSDCLSSRVVYNQRLGRLSFDVSLINL